MKMLRLILGAILVFFIGGTAIASGYLQLGLKECLWGMAIAIILLIITGIAYRFGLKDGSSDDT